VTAREYAVALFSNRPPLEGTLLTALQSDPALRLVTLDVTDEVDARLRVLDPDLVVLHIHGTEWPVCVNDWSVIAEPPPFLLVVCEDDRHWKDAIRLHAIDYLVNPTDCQCRKALQWVKRQVDRHRVVSTHLADGMEGTEKNVFHSDKILVKEGGHSIILSMQEIDWIEALGNYIRLHTSQRKYILRRTISDAEHHLPPERFVRIHRSTIVNLDRISELHQTVDGDHAVVLNNGTTLILSRSYRERLLSCFSHIL